MSFSILLSSEALKEFDEPVLRGEVDIDGYTERFLSPTEFWSRSDYLSSWKNSLNQGLQERSHAALITSMRDPGSFSFLFYWVVFIEGDIAFIRNRVLFLQDLTSPFVPEKINDYILPRGPSEDDEGPISEWTVDLQSVVEFYNRL